MTDEKPISPWKLTPGRIIILLFGVLIVVYVASALMGGLGNYQALRESATTPAVTKP